MVATADRKNNTKFTNEVMIARDWLRHHTAKGYGIKTPVGVRHKLKKKKLEYAITQGWSGLYPSLTLINDHCLELATAYMTASDSSDYIFGMIDVDVLKNQALGTIKGGRDFIQYLSSIWPGLYIEESTNHKGQHGYLRLHVQRLTARQRNDLFKKLDAYLKYLARKVNADIVYRVN